ncbi:MAG: lysophospholipase [Saprospiraceae bacterium]
MSLPIAKEFSWKANDGVTIFARELPVDNPRAVMGIIHGLGEHGGRYDELADYFREHGIAVLTYDRRGHGRSSGKRGHTPAYSFFLDEVAKLLIECERRYSDLPVFLFGHSMGGNILLNYLIHRKPRISGAVVSAPHIRLPFEPSPLLIGFGKLIRSIYPSFSQHNQLDQSKLSRDPAFNAHFDADPLTHDRITSQTALSIIEKADELDAYDGPLPAPTLIMHGDADALTDFGGSRDFAGRVSGGPVTFRAWPGLYHDLVNDPEKARVKQFILEWLEPLMQKEVHRRAKSV